MSAKTMERSKTTVKMVKALKDGSFVFERRGTYFRLTKENVAEIRKLCLN